MQGHEPDMSHLAMQNRRTVRTADGDRYIMVENTWIIVLRKFHVDPVTSTLMGRASSALDARGDAIGIDAGPDGCRVGLTQQSSDTRRVEGRPIGAGGRGANSTNRISYGTSRGSCHEEEAAG